MITRVEKTSGPLVSCVMATARRPAFLKQAIRYFLRQTYEPKELIIVDDEDRTETSTADIIPDDPRISYSWVKPMPLGAKLNHGVAQAKGVVIQKLDDDDWYHPWFLSTMVATMAPKGFSNVMGSTSTFLVFLKETGELKHAGHTWFIGGSLAFSKDVWAKKPFEEIMSGEDDRFIKDHGTARKVATVDPELYMVVRHGQGHAWVTERGKDVDQFFGARPLYGKPLEAFMAADEAVFYRNLARR